MAKNIGSIPEGTRDLLFKECENKREIENRILNVFRERGYSEVITPSFEFYDVFAAQTNSLPQEMMYKFFDSKGRIIVMRPDNTTPIARLTATKLKGFIPPLRLYYCQNIFRISPSMTGRRDEITQCGIEMIGVNGQKADIEVIQTALTLLKNMAPESFRFEIGHVGFFKSIIDSLPYNKEFKEDIRTFVESKNYAELKALLEPYIGENKSVTALLELPKLFGGKEVFEKALRLAPNEEAVSTIHYLRTIYDELCLMGLEKNIMLDLGLVHQIDYYSGTVFRGYMQGSGTAVLFGGRYDGLFGRFGAELPATGFAVNTDAVAASVEIFSRSNRPDVLIFSDFSYARKAFEYMDELISKNHICEMSVFDTLEESKQYALQKGIQRIDTVSEKIETIILDA